MLSYAPAHAPVMGMTSDQPSGIPPLTKHLSSVNSQRQPPSGRLAQPGGQYFENPCQMGDYRSPQFRGASGEATAPMVAVLADQGLPGGTGQRAPGIGPDGRVVVVQTKLPLRHGDQLTYRRWDADFNNCAEEA